MYIMFVLMVCICSKTVIWKNVTIFSKKRINKVYVNFTKIRFLSLCTPGE